MTDLTLESLAERVERLERENGRLKERLETKGVGLRDDNGIVRLSLGLWKGTGQPGLTLSDANRTPRASLSLDPEGRPALTFFGPAGKPRAMFLVDDREQPSLRLHHAVGRGGAGLGVAMDGKPHLILHDADGNRLFSAP
jgi:hypothetical protein